MRTLLALSIISFVTLAACSQSLTATVSASPTQPAAAMPSQAAGEKPGPELAGGAVIEYRRTGGIAGLDETFTVYADGLITSAAGQEWRVSAQDVGRLLNQIEQAGFFQVKATGPSIVPCCDRFSYTFVVMLNGQSHTAWTYDGAQSQPAAIQGTFDAIAGFIQANTAP